VKTFNALHNPTYAKLWGPYTGTDADIMALSAIAEVALPVTGSGSKLEPSSRLLVRNPEVDRSKIARASTEWQELQVGGYVVFQPTGCVYPISAEAYARNWTEITREVLPF